jgi:hypothetical protein
MNPDIIDKILRALIVFLQVEKPDVRIPLGNVSHDDSRGHGEPKVSHDLL